MAAAARAFPARPFARRPCGSSDPRPRAMAPGSRPWCSPMPPATMARCILPQPALPMPAKARDRDPQSYRARLQQADGFDPCHGHARTPIFLKRRLCLCDRGIHGGERGQERLYARQPRNGKAGRATARRWKIARSIARARRQSALDRRHAAPWPSWRGRTRADGR